MRDQVLEKVETAINLQEYECDIYLFVNLEIQETFYLMSQNIADLIVSPTPSLSLLIMSYVFCCCCCISIGYFIVLATAEYTNF